MTTTPDPRTSDSHHLMGIASSPRFSLTHPGVPAMVSEGFRRGVDRVGPAETKDVL